MENSSIINMRTPGQRTHRVERSQSLKNYAYRQRDAETDDFVRFIRDYQCEKQPTHLRLQKNKLPLPDIGKLTNNSVLGDSGFLDKISDTSDSDDVPLDSEVSLALDNHRLLSHRRKDVHVEDVLSLTRSQTRDNILLNKSLPKGLHHSFDGLRGNPGHCHSELRRKNKNINLCVQKNNRHAKHLPPISREDLPDRPSAPSPSATPPLGGYDAGSIEEEPIDYIDSA